MIISDNTERGSIKLTCCSCRKKSIWSGKFISKGTLKYKTKLIFELKFLLPNLRSGVLCWAQSCHTQSNHLHGNPRYTLTELLLANLTHLQFVFGFCLARKNGFESVWLSETFHLNTRYSSNFKDFAVWPFPPVPGRVWVTLSCAKMSSTQCLRHFMSNERLLWDIPEILEAKDDEWLISRKYSESRKQF